MKIQIEKLHRISNKPERIVIGLMSGTSLDGLDIALCKVSNSGLETKVKVLEFKTTNYPNSVKEKIRKVFAKESIDFRYLTLLNQWIASLHASYIKDALKEWNYSKDNIDLIASHGQTVMHVPKESHDYKEFTEATLQLGDGDKISVDTGIITISDFRQKHIAGGGGGAPLVLYGDLLIFSSDSENRILLNLGGIANYTFIPKGKSFDLCFATDTGPGNTILDAMTKKFFPEKDFDEDSKLSLKGKVNLELLNLLKDNSFFSEKVPKTTGPELFNVKYVEDCIHKGNLSLSKYDILATLTQFSAVTIASSIKATLINEADKNYKIYASGGGASNPLLVKSISKELGLEIINFNELGIHPDAKEAVLFALLANETVSGSKLQFSNNPRIPSVSMGKISFPD